MTQLAVATSLNSASLHRFFPSWNMYYLKHYVTAYLWMAYVTCCLPHIIQFPKGTSFFFFCFLQEIAKRRKNSTYFSHVGNSSQAMCRNSLWLSTHSLKLHACYWEEMASKRRLNHTFTPARLCVWAFIFASVAWVYMYLEYLRQ